MILLIYFSITCYNVYKVIYQSCSALHASLIRILVRWGWCLQHKCDDVTYSQTMLTFSDKNHKSYQSHNKLRTQLSIIWLNKMQIPSIKREKA